MPLDVYNVLAHPVSSSATAASNPVYVTEQSRSHVLIQGLVRPRVVSWVLERKTNTVVPADASRGCVGLTASARLHRPIEAFLDRPGADRPQILAALSCKAGLPLDAYLGCPWTHTQEVDNYATQLTNELVGE